MRALSALVLEHFENPRCVGVFDETEPQVFTGRAGSCEHGELVQLQLQMDLELRAVREVRCKVLGNAYLIATLSWLSEFAAQKTCEDMLKLSEDKLISSLNLPKNEHYCAVLCLEAVKSCLQFVQHG